MKTLWALEGSAVQMNRSTIHRKTSSFCAIVLANDGIVDDIRVLVPPPTDHIEVLQSDPEGIHLPVTGITTSILSMRIDRLFDRLRFRRWAQCSNFEIRRCLQGIAIETFQYPCATIKRVSVFPVVSGHQHKTRLRKKAAT